MAYTGKIAARVCGHDSERSVIRCHSTNHKVLYLHGLKLPPTGVVPQSEKQPRWIYDYSSSSENDNTLTLAIMEAVQSDHALDWVQHEILLASPELGPVQLLKVGISDGFYCINLNIDNILKIGVVFPISPGKEEPILTVPLVLLA